MPTGRCHCGKVVYGFQGGIRHSSVCHCEDCRKCAGAPSVAWMAVASDDFAIERGKPRLYRSSPDAERYFCGDCGTGLYYVNENVLPGLVDIQVATLDDPEAFPPQIHVQMADALGWEAGLGDLPSFDRYPSG
ncbi:GFA family protein [Leptolyngbya sp. 15MV]|nr:GFA family protein [Leptolyngbya sp. 15MV]